MRRARPSTIAVLPTPGSPMSTGLFLVRRDSTWMTRRISSSRPMTGSIFPARASSVRSRPYFSSAWYCSSGFWEVTRWLPRTSCIAASSCSRVDAEAVGQRQEQVLGRQVLVVQLGPLRVGRVDDLLELAGHAGLAAVRLRQLADGVVGRVAHRERGQPDALQDRQHDALLLAQQRGEQVVGGDLGVALGLGHLDGAC